MPQRQSSCRGRSPSPVVIAPGEDILMANVDGFEAAMTSAIAAGKRNLIVDLERVEYFSALGMGALLRGLRQARESGGEIKLIHVSGSLRRLFELSGLGSVLDICETEEEAVASFGEDVGPVERTLLWTIRRNKKDPDP